MTKSPVRKAAKTAAQPREEGSGSAQPRAIPLNFKVPAEFRREFKTYAAQNNKKLNQLLYEAFAALKASHAK